MDLPKGELGGLGGEKFSLALEDVEAPQPGSSGPGDIALRVSCSVGEFAAEAVTWIERQSWSQFVSDLIGIEQRRRGRACLEGMSPGELGVTLVVGAGGRELTLDWVVGEGAGRRYAQFRVSGIGVDLGMLPAFVSAVRRIESEL